MANPARPWLGVNSERSTDPLATAPAMSVQQTMVAAAVTGSSAPGREGRRKRALRFVLHRAPSTRTAKGTVPSPTFRLAGYSEAIRTTDGSQ